MFVLGISFGDNSECFAVHDGETDVGFGTDSNLVHTLEVASTIWITVFNEVERDVACDAPFECAEVAHDSLSTFRAILNGDFVLCANSVACSRIETLEAIKVETKTKLWVKWRARLRGCAC